MRYQLADFPQYKYGEEDCVISWLWKGGLRYQLQLAELEFPLSEFPLSETMKEHVLSMSFIVEMTYEV